MSNDIDISVDGLGEITIEDKTLGRNESDTLYNYSDGYTLNLLANELEIFSGFVEWQTPDSILVDNTTALDTTAEILDGSINLDYRTYIEGETESSVVDEIVVVFTFDKSGSMNSTQLTETANAINNFIDQAYNDSEVTMYYAIVEYGADANISSGSDFIEATDTSYRADTDTSNVNTGGTSYTAAIDATLDLFYTTSIDLSNATKTIIHTSDGDASFDHTSLVTIDGTEKTYSQHAKDNNLNHIYSLVIYESTGNVGMKNICRMIHNDEDILPDNNNDGYYKADVDSSNIDTVYTEILNTIKTMYIYQTFSSDDNSSFNNITITNTTTLLTDIIDQNMLENDYPDLDISTCNIITEIKNIQDGYTTTDIEVTPGTNVAYSDTINKITAKSTVTYSDEHYIIGVFQNDGYIFTTYKSPSEGGSVNVDSNPHNLSGNLYGYFNEGQSINIEAVPNTGYTFNEWVRDVNGTSTTQSIVIDKDKEAEALFNTEEYTLQVNILPDESYGSYIIDPKKDLYNTGENITVTGSENDGGIFDRIEYSEGLNNVSVNGMEINFDIVNNAVIDYYFQAEEYVLNIEIVGEGDVNVTPNPGDLTAPDYGYYNYNDSIEIEAIEAVEGWEFSHWELDIESSNQIENFNIQQDMNVRAVFTSGEYKLLAETYGNGEILLEEVDVYNSQGDVQSNYINRTYNKNDIVDLTYKETNDCWYFKEWLNDLTGVNKTEQLTINEDKYVVGDFDVKQYVINTDTVGEGSIEISPSQNKYECDSTVDIEAIPNEGWVFDHWEGDLNTPTNPESFLVDKDKNITAIFIKKKYTLDITINGTGNVNVNPSKTEYSYGEEVTLQAEDIDDSNFVSYTYENESPSTVSTDRYQNIIMDEDKVITVLFETSEYVLTVETIGQGNVEVTPEKDIYSAGDLIELNAIAESNWMFYTWSSSPKLNLEDNEDSFNITQDTYITAYFNRSIDKAVNYELINNRYKGMVESYKFNKQNHQTELNLDTIQEYYQSVNSLISNINDNLEERRVLKRRLLSLKEKIKRLYRGVH